MAESFPKALYWQNMRRLSKLSRQHRRRNAKKWMPVIREVCRRMGVTIRKVDHGFQFIRDEYIINWSPSTNRVSIQYRMSGHDRSIPFNKDGKPGKPRILIALEELVEIVRNEDRPRDKTS